MATTRPSNPTLNRLRSSRSGHRERLIAAMIEAVSRHGYADTTLAELARRAHVSKSTFYAHFSSKEECFLAAFDTALGIASERIASAYRARGDFRERLRCAFGAFVETVIAEPTTASVIIAESLTLGPAGVGNYYRTAAVFEQLLRQGFDEARDRGEVSDLTIRAIVGGIRRVVYCCLREGRPEELRQHIDPLLDWALSYQEMGRATSGRGRRGRATGNGRDRNGGHRVGSAAHGNGAPGWDAPPGGLESRMALSQRERIVRAAAQVAVREGFESLSIPSITAAAGVSNQTFYQHFEGAEAAVLAAFDALADDCFRIAVARAATEADACRAVAAGMDAVLDYLAVNPLFARLAFVEVPTAGHEGWDRSGEITRRFARMLGEPPSVGVSGEPLPASVLEAIGGGIWTLVHYEVARGATERLPDLSSPATFVALAPLVHAGRRAGVALDRGRVPV